ncbi:MAG: hypothetical protein AAFQ22_00055 [Pseudomonadota bacterium]
MNLKKALLAGAALMAVAGMPAQASIVDNPHFRVLGLVVVWSADAGGNTVVNDFVIGAGAAGGTDLISGTNGNTVVTGSLAATATSVGGASNFDITGAVTSPNFSDVNSDGFLDAGDTFDAFTIDDTTDVGVSGAQLNSSFFVASNTAFNIVADADLVTDPATTDFTLADIGFSLSHTNDDTGQTEADGTTAFAFGSAANASVGTSTAAVTDLGDIETAGTVFTGSARTAANRGTIQEQSVRFDATYTLGGTQGYDLSMGAGDVEADVTYTIFVP